ncbi:MAG: hypothetical protein GF309_09630 [Candidatus Lokiarchaeota archaeon]|nr:hypothetical protein [Candidatus Lokiarchaeota archaeon]
MENGEINKPSEQMYFALVPLLYGIAASGASIFLFWTNSIQILSTIGRILLVATPLVIGAISITEFVRGGIAFGDRYSIMNTSCAFALCILGISEAVFLVVQDSAPTEIGKAVYYTVAAVGILPWVGSVISYLRQSNEVLGFLSNPTLKYILILCSILCPIPGILLLFGMGVNTGLTSIVAAYPLFAMSALLILTLGYISWIFRRGQFIRPLLLIFVGTCFAAVHFGMQSGSSTLTVLLVNPVTGILGYSLLGSALLLAFAMIDNL